MLRASTTQKRGKKTSSGGMRLFGNRLMCKSPAQVRRGNLSEHRYHAASIHKLFDDPAPVFSPTPVAIAPRYIMPWHPQATIHLGALRNNLAQVRQYAPGCRVMAVIKADAYGHGLLPVAQALHTEVDMLAVARLHEAVRLRESGIHTACLLYTSDAADE